MSTTHLVYATSNPGKIIEIGRLFGLYGFRVRQLSDFTPAKLDPEESGRTLGDNAVIKALAYARALAADPKLRGQRFIVIADDTGVFIDGLAGEPGIRVRRWVGRKMSDEEIIRHCLARMEGLSGSQRNAHFRTVLCMVSVDEAGAIGAPVTTEGTLDGRIMEKAWERRFEGFPFESIFYADEYGMLLGELHSLPDAEKWKGKFNHRERAIQKAIPLIRDMVGEG